MWDTARWGGLGTDVLLEPFDNLTAGRERQLIVAGRTGTGVHIVGSVSAQYVLPRRSVVRDGRIRLPPSNAVAGARDVFSFRETDDGDMTNTLRTNRPPTR